MSELSGQLYAPAALTLGKKPVTNCVEEWVGLRDTLDGLGGEENFALSGIYTSDLPARSESQCRLRRSGSTLKNKAVIFYCISYVSLNRSQWPRGLRRGFAIALLQGLWVRTLPGHG
jgi:hypothetical protein